MNQPIATAQLLEPVFREGILNTHFFNGRLLTAEDLRTDQQANRHQHEQLGQALGHGVVYGLDVSLLPSSALSPPQVSQDAHAGVRVTAGLAINRKGQALTLPREINVALARQQSPLPPEAGLFSEAECNPPTSTTEPLAGVYILVIAPTSGFREKVGRSGLDAKSQPLGCGSRYAVEGVKFRRIELNLNSMVGIDPKTRDEVFQRMQSEDNAARSRLRNQLAHLCFGTEQSLDQPRDLLTTAGTFNVGQTYGALDSLRAQGVLKNCDVPLALVLWDSGGIEFVDMWSVRRRLTPPGIATNWPFASQRRLPEAEASLWQFQDHIAALMRSGLSDAQLRQVKATDYFRYLPAAGILPLAEFGNRGFALDTFFAAQPHRPRDGMDRQYMDGMKVRAMLNDSLTYEPIDLQNNPGQMVWLYRVWQNEKSVDGATASGPRYAVFTSPHMPPQGVARFDVARWGYSNYQDRL